MPWHVLWPASGALDRHMKAISGAIAVNSEPSYRVRADVRRLVIEDHADKMLRGVDRYGQPRAALAESTLKKPGRGDGPSLIPRGAGSRFITHFEPYWTFDERDRNHTSILGMRFTDIVNDRGQPFAQYHLAGATKPGTNWVLPRRDVAGVTPKGWAAIGARMRRFAAEVLGAGRKG